MLTLLAEGPPTTGHPLTDLLAVLAAVALTVLGAVRVGGKLFADFLERLAKSQESRDDQVVTMFQKRIDAQDADAVRREARYIDTRDFFREQLREITATFREAIERIAKASVEARVEDRAALREMAAEFKELRASMLRGDMCYKTPAARHNGAGTRGIGDAPDETADIETTPPEPF